MCEEDKLAVAKRIRSYLETRREADDSLAGIVAWWLMRQRYQDSAERVSEAVEYLQQEGQIFRLVLPDGSVRYSARPPRPAPR